VARASIKSVETAVDGLTDAAKKIAQTVEPKSKGPSKAKTAKASDPSVRVEKRTPAPVSDKSASDDLTLIKGVGPSLEKKLHQLGIFNFDQIAHWSAKDVVRFDEQLGRPKGRVKRDDWVGQAKALLQNT
jgi:NADH-quinone oxidoreductase subunit E